MIHVLHNNGSGIRFSTSLCRHGFLTRQIGQILIPRGIIERGEVRIAEATLRRGIVAILFVPFA